MKESQCCRMKAMEDEYHFVMICPAYRHLRLRYLLKYYCSRLNISKYVLLYNLVQDLCYLNFVIYLMIIGSYGHSCLHNLLLIIYIYLYLFTFFIHIVDYLQLTLIVSNSVDSNFGWVEFLSKFRTSLCINIYNLTPVESNLDESKFRLSRIKVLVPRCRKPYYLHSLSRIYLSKHVYYLGIKIGSQVKHPVIDFDIFTLGYFTCLF